MFQALCMTVWITGAPGYDPAICFGWSPSRLRARYQSSAKSAFGLYGALSSSRTNLATASSRSFAVPISSAPGRQRCDEAGPAARQGHPGPPWPRRRRRGEKGTQRHRTASRSCAARALGAHRILVVARALGVEYVGHAQLGQDRLDQFPGANRAAGRCRDHGPHSPLLVRQRAHLNRCITKLPRLQQRDDLGKPVHPVCSPRASGYATAVAKMDATAGQVTFTGRRRGQCVGCVSRSHSKRRAGW